MTLTLAIFLCIYMKINFNYKPALTQQNCPWYKTAQTSTLPRYDQIIYTTKFVLTALNRYINKISHPCPKYYQTLYLLSILISAGFHTPLYIWYFVVQRKPTKHKPVGCRINSTPFVTRTRYTRWGGDEEIWEDVSEMLAPIPIVSFFIGNLHRIKNGYEYEKYF